MSEKQNQKNKYKTFNGRIMQEYMKKQKMRTGQLKIYGINCEGHKAKKQKDKVKKNRQKGQNNENASP